MVIKLIYNAIAPDARNFIAASISITLPLLQTTTNHVDVDDATTSYAYEFMTIRIYTYGIYLNPCDRLNGSTLGSIEPSVSGYK